MRNEMDTPSSESSARARAYWLVGCVVAATHLVLLLLDMLGGDGFFRADRAQQRFGNMVALIEASRTFDGFLQTLAAQGNIGDYGLHAALFWSIGRLGTTVVQSILAVSAAVCVVHIALRTVPSRRIAIASGLVYAFLPQSLAFPHQLLSEAFSNPFLIFGVAGFLYALESGERLAPWIASGLWFGLAGLVRPALVPLPLVAAVLLILIRRQRSDVSRVAGFVVSGFVPFVLWGLCMLSQTGRFGLGESHQDLGLNLSQSTAKVLLSEGLSLPDGSPPAWLPGRLTIPQYLGYVSTYPAGFANLYGKNTLVLIADSGIGRLYVDLLGFGAEARIQLQDPLTGWRAQLTNHGMWRMLVHGLKVAPGTIIAGVLGACAFAFVTIGVVGAYVSMFRLGSQLRVATNSLTRRWAIAFLMILPFYVLATSQVVAYAPSRLRSQGEFAWAILGCIGWTFFAQLKRARPQT